MGRVSIRELRQRGVSDEDIQQARQLQATQRQAGVPVQSLAVIVGVSRPAQRTPAVAPIDFTARALRRLGEYDQAALMLDQVALREKSPERAQRAREASNIAKELGASQQLEFDFFKGGNVSIAFQYQDAVTERLREAAPSPARMDEALAILWQICRHLGWQTYECTKTAADLCDIMHKDKAAMARALDLLEQVGAIRRVKRGRIKTITVTPEGAFRGNVNNHGAAVERYRLEVIEGGRAQD